MDFKCLATDKIKLKEFIKGLPDCKLKNKCKKSEGKEFIRKYFVSEKISDHNVKKGMVLNYITKETLDRDNEVIKLDGIKLNHFLGAVYWNHDYSLLPVAKNLWAKNDGNGILASTVFLDKTEFQRGVKSMYTDDIEDTGPVLKSFSMGFIPIKFHYATESDKKMYGKSTQVIYDEIEMFEYSAVGIPANRDALTVAVGKGFDLFSQKTLPDTVIKIIDNNTNETNIETKSFSHNSKIADTEPDWGDVDKTELPAKSFVFEAEEFDKDKKSTWKFPHHFVQGGDGVKDENGVLTDGTLFLHKGGLNAAYSAAQGARSGQVAEQAVLDHLDQHRKALGLDKKEVKPDSEPDNNKKKGVDIDGTISVDDIKSAIIMALNPPTPDVQDNKMYWEIEDLFPSNYPDGHVIVEGYNLVTFVESPRQWRYEYRIEDKKAILSNPVEVEEKLQVVSGLMPPLKNIKAGRMLSNHNRGIINKAMTSLQSVLDADEKKTIRIIDNKKKNESFTSKDVEGMIKSINSIVKDTVQETLVDVKNIKVDLEEIAEDAIKKALGKVR